MNLINFIRKNSKLNQQDFASALHVSFATVNRWENNKTIPSPLFQKALYEFCLQNNIDIIDYIMETLTQERLKLEATYPKEKVLFHGSKSGIDGKIRPISRSQCDFGKGFYMGNDYINPFSLICNHKNSKLYLVSIDMTDLNVLKIPSDISWAFVVAYNRGRLDIVKGKEIYNQYKEMLHGCDLIIGNIADDRMFFVLDNFFEGNISDVALVDSLSSLHLGIQYVAVTQKACDQIRILQEYNPLELELMAFKDVSELRRLEGITKANEICKKHRREGKFFDEYLGDFK